MEDKSWETKFIKDSSKEVDVKVSESVTPQNTLRGVPLMTNLSKEILSILMVVLKARIPDKKELELVKKELKNKKI